MQSETLLAGVLIYFVFLFTSFSPYPAGISRAYPEYERSMAGFECKSPASAGEEAAAVPSKQHSPTLVLERKLSEMSHCLTIPTPAQSTILNRAPGIMAPILIPVVPHRPSSAEHGQRWPSEISTYDIPSPPANGKHCFHLCINSLILLIL